MPDVVVALVKGSAYMHVMTRLDDRTGFAVLLCEMPEAFLQQALRSPSLVEAEAHLGCGVCRACRERHEATTPTEGEG